MTATTQKLADYSEQADAQIRSQQAHIDRKEYQMQRMELKIYNYEKYLQRRALQDKEAVALLKKFEARLAPTKEERLTNVVEDNNNLRQELRSAMREITKLEREKAGLQSRLEKLDRPFEQFNLETDQNEEVDIYGTVR